MMRRRASRIAAVCSLPSAANAATKKEQQREEGQDEGIGRFLGKADAVVLKRIERRFPKQFPQLPKSAHGSHSLRSCRVQMVVLSGITASLGIMMIPSRIQ